MRERYIRIIRRIFREESLHFGNSNFNETIYIEKKRDENFTYTR